MSVEVAQMDAVGRLGVAIKRIDALKAALYAIIELDHHNMGPESRATKLARDALTAEQ